MHTGFTTTGLNYKGKLQGTQRHRGHEEIKQTIVLGLRCRNKDRYRNLVRQTPTPSFMARRKSCRGGVYKRVRVGRSWEHKATGCGTRRNKDEKVDVLAPVQRKFMQSAWRGKPIQDGAEVLCLVQGGRRRYHFNNTLEKTKKKSNAQNQICADGGWGGGGVR